MKKIVLLAVLALVLVAVPAFASVQNIKVSGDIDSTYVYRNQFDFGGVVNTATQSFFMTQTQLRVDADLTDKVSATVRLLNERPWGVDSSDSNIDLNLAYVTIKEMLYSPLTVVVGRQAFAYGNSFVVDSEGPNRANVVAGGLNGVAEDLSKRRAMDAIRAILDYNPLTIDLVYAKIDAQGLTSTLDDQKDDIDLMGINANYKLGDKNNTVLEGYFWAKVDRSALLGSTNSVKTDTVYVPGIHASTNLLDGLMLSGEIALQRGTDSAISTATAAKREALAWQTIANYALPFEKTKKYSPVLTTSLTYLSGEKCNQLSGEACNTPTLYGRKTTAWDPMFENQSSGKIYNTLFAYSNAYIAGVKGAIKPIDDVTASAEYTTLWLDKQTNVATIGTSEGSTVATTSEYGSKKLGDEIDLGLKYAYTEDVTIGASLGWFYPGDVFQSVNDKIASQALVNLDVKF